MRHRILSMTGVLNMSQSIILDRSDLWNRFDCDQAVINHDFSVIHITDDMKLRKYYEFDCRDKPDAKNIIVIDHACVLIPYDIRIKIRVIDLSFGMLFPTLDSKVLSRLPGLDFDHLAFVVDRMGISKQDEQATSQLCQFELRTAPLAAPYGNKLMEDAVSLVQNIISHRDWTRIAKAYGKAAMFQHAGISLDAFEEKRRLIENKFVEWISQKYALLSGTVDKERPVLLSKVNSFIKRGNSKIALILMDGMSFENFFTIQRALMSESFTYQIESSFSFFPTVTSVARQSVFSGKLPMEHSKPFSLDNEEKQWIDYWMEQGYRKNEIGFYKTETPDIPSTVKVAGIIVNICDDLMHDELQGMLGLQQGLENWAKNLHLVHLLKLLQKQEFAIYMTADHGNTSAIAEGRFQKPGVLAEPASRRAVIYKSFTDAQELNKFTTEQYSGTYLPQGFTAYLFDAGTSYGDRGKEYITHGGMTLEEAVVPFIRIGEYNG